MIKSLVQAFTLLGAANAVRLNQCCGMQVACAQPCEEQESADITFADEILLTEDKPLPPPVVEDIVETVVEEVAEEEEEVPTEVVEEIVEKVVDDVVEPEEEAPVPELPPTEEIIENVVDVVTEEDPVVPPEVVEEVVETVVEVVEDEYFEVWVAFYLHNRAAILKGVS